MNQKQLLVIVVVALVLGGIVLYSNKQKSASFQRGERIAGEKLLGDFPVNDVAHRCDPIGLTVSGQPFDETAVIARGD